MKERCILYRIMVTMAENVSGWMTMSDPCSGCKDNYYNATNKQGVKECWHKDKIKRGKCPMKYEIKGTPLR